MRRFTPFALALFVSGAVLAADAKPPVSPLLPKPPDPAAIMVAVKEVGIVNGIALACGHKDTIARAKALMIMRVPKTREYGEIFESASNESFLAQSVKKGGCPGRATCSARQAEANQADVIKVRHSFPSCPK